MNPEITAFVLGSFIALWLIHLLYWNIFQPVLLRGLLFRLFSRRDHLRRMAISGTCDPNTFAYKDLENTLCKSIAVVPRIGFTSLIWFGLFSKNKDEAAKTLKKFQTEAPPELVRIRDFAIMETTAIFMINSPLLLLFLIILVGLLFIAGVLKKALAIADSFVESLPLPEKYQTA